MDCGWYALNVIRVLMGRQVPDVTGAEAQVWKHDSEIDEGMRASFDFPNGDSKNAF
jgi:predicted dehydrogenase